MNDPAEKLPLTLYRANDVRELDRIAIAEHALPGRLLMQRAGESVWRALRLRWPRAARVLVVCGSGNNGGDGYVVATAARQAGLDVSVLQLGDRDRSSDDALHFAHQWLAEPASDVSLSQVDFGSFDLLIDAALGTGLQRPISGDFATAIAAMNASHVPIIAIDIPSGLDADTGAVLGVAAQAELTVSFIGLKRGLFTAQGPQHCGTIVFDALGVPAAVYAEGPAPAARVVTASDVGVRLKARQRGAHKGDFGHVLVVGGDLGYGGAAVMAAEAALRVGAGLVTVATRTPHVGAIIARRPEIMVRAMEEASDLEGLLDRVSVLALGPGLGTNPWGCTLFKRAMESAVPMVVDADALNLLAKAPVARDNWILTPHPGEAARLLQSDTQSIQRDRFAAARKIAQRYGGVCILKGAGTIISDAVETPAVVTAGNPGMATGGMGDVLTGVVAALLAQGSGPGPAAELGAWLHARAADLAARNGERGLLATDLLPHLRSLANPAPPSLELRAT